MYKYLKSEIIKRTLNCDSGDLFLSEKNISKNLNVSRTPIREAISRLSVEGFLVNAPNHGVVINKISIEDLEDLLQIRIAIEGLAVKLASKRIGKEKIKELKNLIGRAKSCIRRKDALSFCEIDVQFHDTIVDSSGNRRLKDIYENIKDKYLPFRIKSFSSLSRLEESCREIENITMALEAHNDSKAEALFQEHISNGYRNIFLIEKKDIVNNFTGVNPLL